MPRVGTIDVEGLEHGAVIAVAQKAGLRGYGFRTERGTRLLVESVAGRREAADALARALETLGYPLRFELVNGVVFFDFPALEEVEIAKRPPKALGHVDRVDANGNIYGWAAALDDDRVRVRLLIDGKPIGQVHANIFRPDLLRASVGLGGHGFKFRPPETFLDGNWHEVEAEVVETRQRFGRSLRLPFHFNCPRPWLGSEPTEGWTAADENAWREIRQDVMLGGPLSGARELVERKPMAIWRDLGLFERYARRGEKMPGFKTRLDTRIALLYGPTPCREENCCKSKPLGYDPSLIGECSLLLRHFAWKPFVKQYAASLNVPTAQTLGWITSADDFDRFDFPERYVIKPVRDSGRGLFLMHHGLNLFDGFRYSRAELRAAVLHYLSYGKSDALIVEELLIQEGVDSTQPTVPLDFKLQAFGGKVRLLRVNDSNTTSCDPTRRRRFSWLARDWSAAPSVVRAADHDNEPVRKPKCFDLMLKIADRIAADLQEYIRIDMYATDKGPVLGELTTYSQAGIGFTDYGDLILSQAWELFPDSAKILVGAPALKSDPKLV